MSAPMHEIEPAPEPATWAPGKRAEYGVDLGVPARHAVERDDLASRLQVEYWAARAANVRGGTRLAASLRKV